MNNPEIKKGDIIANNGCGIYILSIDKEKNEKRISKKYFKELINKGIIYYDRTQWGVDHFLVK